MKLVSILQVLSVTRRATFHRLSISCILFLHCMTAVIVSSSVALRKLVADQSPLITTHVQACCWDPETAKSTCANIKAVENYQINATVKTALATLS